MSPLVEEFYNRVHNPADGQFGTSGTGGGHYKGRATGAKNPRGSSAKSSASAAKSTTTKAAPKRDVNAEAKAHVAGLLKAHEDRRAGQKAKRDLDAKAKDHVAGLLKAHEERRAAAKAKGPGAPKKKDDGGDDTKLNDIAKLKQNLLNTKSSTAPAGPKPAANRQDKTAAPSTPNKKKSDKIKRVGKLYKAFSDKVLADRGYGHDRTKMFK